MDSIKILKTDTLAQDRKELKELISKRRKVIAKETEKIDRFLLRDVAKEIKQKPPTNRTPGVFLSNEELESLYSWVKLGYTMYGVAKATYGQLGFKDLTTCYNSLIRGWKRLGYIT